MMMNAEGGTTPQSLERKPSASPKLVQPPPPPPPPEPAINSGGITPNKVELGNGMSHITIPIINTISVPSSTATAATTPHQTHSHHFQVGHLPLSLTTSLNNHAATGIRNTAAATRAERQSKKSIDPRSTPKRGNFNKVNRKGKSHQIVSKLKRPCEHHSFLTEITDVQQMEQGLVQLLDDFHSGKLQAFGKDCSFQKMDNVREQQERLARLHFDLGSQQDPYGTLSDEGGALAKDHLTKLVTQLQELSLAIEQLQSSTSGNNLQTEV